MCHRGTEADLWATGRGLRAETLPVEATREQQGKKEQPIKDYCSQQQGIKLERAGLQGTSPRQ